MNKLIIKRAVCLLLAIILVTMLCVSAFAEGDRKSQRYNIMLVMDAGSSLFTYPYTDHDNLRYEAVNAILDSIPLEGQYIGAITFSGNKTNNTSEKAMGTGITMNTGLLDMPEYDPESCTAKKKYLKDAISNSSTLDWSTGLCTDLGTALTYAETELLAVNNGLPCAIFLFTDGINELGTPYVQAKSEQYLERAVTSIYENNIKLCGVFLNKDGNYDYSDVRDIVCGSLGVDTNTADLGNSYVEIPNINQIYTARDSFLKLLGMSVADDADYETLYTTRTLTVDIPGAGMEEANFFFETENGALFPTDSTIMIAHPDGTILTDDEIAAAFSQGKTYRNYKIKNPEGGTWTVVIQLNDNNKSGIHFRPRFSTYIDAILKISPEEDQLTVGKEVEVSAVLVKDGNELKGPNAYHGYNCVMELSNLVTGTTDTCDAVLSDNKFLSTFRIAEFGEYTVRAVFTGNVAPTQTSELTFNVQNHLPVGNSISADIKSGLNFEGKYIIDLKDVCDDFDNGPESLEYRIESSNCDTAVVTLNGSVLEIIGNKSESSTIVLSATDSEGETAIFYCYLKVTNFQNMALFAGIILILLLLEALVILIAKV